MSDLQETVEATTRMVKKLLARNGQVGEENTKAVLVDPVLQALGWDIHDLDEVQREYRYRSQGNPVDYALFIGGKPTMFLEAKPLAANLRDHKWRSQVVNYANTAGVEWCVLTDGNYWHIYKSNAPGDLDRKLFLETWFHSPEGRMPPFEPAYVLGLLSKAKLAENEIETLWKALYVDRSAERALLGMVEERDPSFVRLLRKRSELTKRDIEAWLARARVTVDTSLGPLPAQQPPVEQPSKRQARRKGQPLLVPGLPTQRKIEVPLLRAILRRGGEVSARQHGHEIDQELADELGVTQEQRRVLLRHGRETVWSNRVRWARLRLVRNGDLDGSRRGIWLITPKGRQRAEHGAQRTASKRGWCRRLESNQHGVAPTGF